VTEGAADSQKALTDDILADARRQADRARRKAQREAKGIVRDGKQQAEAERRQRLDEARAEADRRRRLTLAAVPVEQQRLRARHVEEALEAIRDEARSRLVSRDGLDYRDLLVRLAAEAVQGMAGTMFVLELSAEDREAFGSDLAQAVADRAGQQGLEISLSPEPAAIEWGVVVRDAEGRQSWDDGLAARLQRFWPEARRAVAEATGLLEDKNNNDEQGMMNGERRGSEES